MDNKEFRRLKIGEIILEGDEYKPPFSSGLRTPRRPVY